MNPSTNLPPGPKGQPIVGNLFARKKDPTGFFQKVESEYGPIAFIPMGHIKVFLFSDAELSKYVLQDAAKNYIKGQSYDGLRKFLGDGIFTAVGEEWREQKQILIPIFQKNAVSAFLPTFHQCISEMMDRWDEEKKETVDLHHAMTNLTLEIISRSLFGTRLTEGSKDELGALVTELTIISNEYTLTPIKFPGWVPTKMNRAIKKNLTALDNIIFSAIKERMKEPGEKKDLLSHLMEVRRHSTGQPLSPQLIRDQVVTLFLAGHETTASSLTWVFWHMAQQKELQSKVHTEIQKPSQSQLLQADYLLSQSWSKAIMLESLRLYPPVWIIPRQVVSADKVRGFDIPAGSIVVVSPYVIHRSPKFWDHPNDFLPERHLKGETMNRYLFLPFSVGPRTCMGELFAALEMLMIIVMMNQRYELVPLKKGEQKLDPVLTLRPKGNFEVKLVRR